MFDQSFSYKHLAEIYAIEKRKGNIPISFLGNDYKAVVDEIKELKNKRNELTKKKKKSWTENERKEVEDVESCINNKKKERKTVENNWLEKMSEVISDPSFMFTISRKPGPKDKDIFPLPKDCPSQFLAMKCLQHNLANLFKVKQANRHLIMSQLRLLLQENLPKYIIRTDIDGFYESIPQYKLLEKLNNNTLLSSRSRRMVKGVLNAFESKKDTSVVAKGKGIPRGIGISAYLAEIYLRDIDEEIKHRPEVLYYVRYVDDIFIMLSHLPNGNSFSDYYSGLESTFNGYGLSLKENKPSEDKVQLLNLHDISKKNHSKNFDYLGYNLFWTISNEGNNIKVKVSFGMSKNKFDTNKTRIDKVYDRLLSESKFNLKKARIDFFDSLKLISGNIMLSKSKAGVKAGIYYSNDLLTDTKKLHSLTQYLHHKPISLYPKLFPDDDSKNYYISKLKKKVEAIDLYSNWENRKMYKFSDKRLKELHRWL